jgi:hypothetical protein
MDEPRSRDWMGAAIAIGVMVVFVQGMYYYVKVSNALIDTLK